MDPINDNFSNPLEFFRLNFPMIITSSYFLGAITLQYPYLSEFGFINYSIVSYFLCGTIVLAITGAVFPLLCILEIMYLLLLNKLNQKIEQEDNIKSIHYKIYKNIINLVTCLCLIYMLFYSLNNANNLLLNICCFSISIYFILRYLVFRKNIMFSWKNYINVIITLTLTIVLFRTPIRYYTARTVTIEENNTSKIVELIYINNDKIWYYDGTQYIYRLMDSDTMIIY
ncbi:MAG: hypothetical protein N4A40_12765 [Tissierellales bacterium]|jgi:hypothetical protein|nr:hypothetical protein [Tissierellales bacterium]